MFVSSEGRYRDQGSLGHYVTYIYMFLDKESSPVTLYPKSDANGHIITYKLMIIPTMLHAQLKDYYWCSGRARAPVQRSLTGWNDRRVRNATNSLRAGSLRTGENNVRVDIFEL